MTPDDRADIEARHRPTDDGFKCRTCDQVWDWDGRTLIGDPVRWRHGCDATVLLAALRAAEARANASEVDSERMTRRALDAEAREARLREMLVAIRAECDRSEDDMAERHGSVWRLLVAVIPSMVDAALAPTKPEADHRHLPAADCGDELPHRPHRSYRAFDCLGVPPDYSRRRHTHSDDVPCIIAGPEGHPPVCGGPEAERP